MVILFIDELSIRSGCVVIDLHELSCIFFEDIKLYLKKKKEQKTNQGLEKLIQQAVEARLEAIQLTSEPPTNQEISNKDTEGTGTSSSIPMA